MSVASEAPELGQESSKRGSQQPPPSVAKSVRATLASLDWPPPPSPATMLRPASGVVDLSRSLGSLAMSGTCPPPAFTESQAALRANELNNRKELWNLRADIEKEKLRHVAPFPFFGLAMRFQDKFAALQITDDGRFSYSFVGLNQEVDVEDSEPVQVEDDPKSRVRTYEGILVSSLDEEPLEPFEPAELEPEGTATIQGLAMLRHEIEEVGGRARLVNVTRSSSRFAIVVSPYFQPSMAVVHSLHLALSPRRPRRTQLPFVGSGMKRDARASPAKTGDIWRLTQERRRAPKPKFSKSGSTGMLPAAAPSSKHRPKDSGGDPSQSSGLARMAGSMPQLPALVEKKDKKDGKARELSSVSDWREFYKQRAQELLGS
mmetsp:Transcript_8716/g.20762  ORF Transcript_8716/g.20762 Transcript_8716/m.20762 type:complete len:375 (+) Transcript_8716:113-1237(+)